MARLNHRVLFFTTSPRTPAKMIPEIELLCDQFSGRPWNKSTQEAFADALAVSPFFEGTGSSSDKAFSARDRITRAPKALGFVDLNPRISLTAAGRNLIYGKRPQETFLRQLLKFQLPSPYHRESKKIAGTFWIRPYLELLRLIRDLGSLTFDELKIFALQLTDYHYYNSILQKIKTFRRDKEQHRGQYKRFVNDIWTDAILDIYRERIAEGKTKTRETRDASLKKFLKTQRSNLRDNADACFRYLRYTGLVSIVHKSRTILIADDKRGDVDFILSHVDRDPVFVEDELKYKESLFDASTPVLYTDNAESIVDMLLRTGAYTRRDLSGLDIESLKDLRDEISARRREHIINGQIAEIKSYALYSEIIDTFHEIISNDYYDAPLMLEYNTWRAMTMLDGGTITGNFKLDDFGQPLSTASGNLPDIECDYGEFSLSVEVTKSTGQRQYESEGEPVARHYGQLKKKSGKDTYCLFIAPSINPAAFAHFYGLNHLNIALYGGKTKIIPLALGQFMQLVENAYIYHGRPGPADIRGFLDLVMEKCDTARDEEHWRHEIQSCVEMWLVS